MIEANTPTALTNDTPDSLGYNQQLTVDQFKEALPKALQSRVSVEVMHGINNLLSNPTTREHFRDNLISYTGVLQSGRFKITSYVDAVKYVSYKLMGDTNQVAWGKTFPNRLTTLINEGADDKTISAHVAAYNKSKLVNAIWEQTLIPSYVLNADLFQKALNVQADLMITARSEKVRADAANSLLSHLKQPEVAKIELDINTKEDQTISDLRASTLELVKQQQQMIKDRSMSAKDIAHSKLVIDGTTGKALEQVD